MSYSLRMFSKVLLVVDVIFLHCMARFFIFLFDLRCVDRGALFYICDVEGLKVVVFCGLEGGVRAL